MNDLLIGRLSLTERLAYGEIYYRGPMTAEEVANYSGVNLDEELESLAHKGILTANGHEYDVSDPNLSPNQIEVAL